MENDIESDPEIVETKKAPLLKLICVSTESKKRFMMLRKNKETHDEIIIKLLDLYEQAN